MISHLKLKKYFSYKSIKIIIPETFFYHRNFWWEDRLILAGQINEHVFVSFVNLK